MKKLPIILVTLDSEPAGGYARVPWYALRQNYFEAIHAAGGLPLAVPYLESCIAHYLTMADGIVISGGDFDIDPSLYGETLRHKTVMTKPDRTAFEWAFLKQAYEMEKPILGICGGMQLLNVMLGGTLFQHIPTDVPQALNHKQEHSRSESGHSIHVRPTSRLYSIVNTNVLEVNTVHHQAIQQVAPALNASAHASDGIIEAIEDSTKPFCLGLQWHPEYHVTSADKAIFSSLIKAASLQ